MRLAVMQPYFFPYLGYFQLINHADKFVLYDDVNFIKQGWINRNNILIGNKAHLFTLPVADISSFKLINEHHLRERGIWDKKLLKTIEMAYARAPYFSEVFPMLESIIHFPAMALHEYVRNSIIQISAYLEIKTQIEPSSVIYHNAHLKSQERIIDICKKENADSYLNMAGGMEIYSKNAFESESIELIFLKSNAFRYKQFSNEFVPYLSILDVMMFNGKINRDIYLSDFQLIRN